MNLLKESDSIKSESYSNVIGMEVIYFTEKK